MKKEPCIINSYENGWEICLTLFGGWMIYKDGKSRSTVYGFGEYEKAEGDLLRMKEEEKCEQLKVSCSAQA